MHYATRTPQVFLPFYWHPNFPPSLPLSYLTGHDYEILSRYVLFVRPLQLDLHAAILTVCHLCFNFQTPKWYMPLSTTNKGVTTPPHYSEHLLHEHMKLNNSYHLIWTNTLSWVTSESANFFHSHSFYFTTSGTHSSTRTIPWAASLLFPVNL